MLPNSRSRDGESRTSRSDRPKAGVVPARRGSPCSIHDTSKERTTVLPAGGGLPTQPNGPSRIPVMPVVVARPPRTAKLSLTLDLSVVNPGDGSSRSQAEQDQLLARRREAISDCSYGTAASSGVVGCGFLGAGWGGGISRLLVYFRGGSVCVAAPPPIFYRMIFHRKEKPKSSCIARIFKRALSLSFLFPSKIKNFDMLQFARKEGAAQGRKGNGPPSRLKSNWISL